MAKNIASSLKNYNLHVLVAEDSKVFRFILGEALKKYFDNIDYAEDGIEALEMFEQKHYDLLLTDVSMPRMDGIELTIEVRRINHSVPILCVSSIKDADKLIELMNAGISAFVIKPISLAKFEEQLTRICEPILKIKNSQKKIADYITLVDKNVEISTTDLGGIITHTSEAFCKLSKYAQEELVGRSHNILRHPDMPIDVYKDLWRTISNEKIWRGEIKSLAKDGSAFWVDATISPIYDDDGEKIGYTAIRHNITDKKRIEDISVTDEMTTLFNRRYFNKIVPSLINSAKRDKKQLGFMILDVDYFKQYNDRYGHMQGDEVLIKIASVMKNVFKRGGDACFRLGGEEFGVIFTVLDTNSAKELSQKLITDIEDLGIEHQGNSASKFVTVSAGIVIRAASEISDFNELYKEADELLYKAKKEGKNRGCTSI